MPYTNIHWIKLQTRLLNDPRFFTMNEDAQLFYIKFILMCANYKNKVPRSMPIIRQILRVSYDDAKIENLISEIRSNFPKVLSHKDYYYIKGFREMHNWVSPGNSQGFPKDAVEKKREDKIRIEKKKIDIVVNFFVGLKCWIPESLHHDDWVRLQKAARDLLIKTNGETSIAIDAIDWISKQGYSWTMETVVKKYPEFKVTIKTPEIQKLEENLEKAQLS